MRFSGFTDEWNEVTLNDVATFSKGKGISKNDISNYGIECVRYGELYTKYNEMIYNIESKTDLDKNELKLSEKNDILIPCSGETAIDLATASCIQKDQVAIGGDITVIKTNQYAPFITYYLNQKKTEIAKYAQGVSIVHLYPKDFKVMNIRIPSINEQKMIIRLLEEITKKEQLLESKYQQYQEFKKYLMQQIFTQKLRFENYNEAIYKISDLYSSKKGTGLSKDKLDEEGLNKCILYGELYTTYNEIIQDVKSKTNSQEGILSKVGDILIPSSTTTKGIDLVTASVILEENVLLGGDITILRSKNENIINNKFFAYYFTNNLVKDVSKLTQGSTIIHLYWKDFKKVKIALPPINEQNKCVDLFLKLDKKIDLINFQIQKMEEFKKGLLQQMFVVQLILSLLQNKKHI